MSDQRIVALTHLEKTALTCDMDGSCGNNRLHGQSLIPVDNDIQAIDAWLSRMKDEHHTHTYRAYHREACRLVLWAIVDRGKAFSSLHTMDMSDYRRFLQNPSPASQWIGPPRKKNDPAWRPFTGPLSERSARYSESVLNSLFTWLVDERYLQTNPMKGMTAFSGGKQQIDVSRSFSKSEWEMINKYLSRKINASEQSDRANYYRVYLILRVLYATGLRLHELAKVRFSDIKKVDRNDKPQYWLEVLGKGNKLREVPIPTGLISVIDEAYLMLTYQMRFH